MKKTALMLIPLIFVPFLISSKSLEQQWLDYANKCYQNQNYSKAASAYDTVLKINPKNTDALTYGGYTYMSLNNPAKALQYLNKAYKLTGDDSLKSQIDNIKATSGAQAETQEITMPPAAMSTAAGKPNDSPFKWVVLGADVVLAGFSISNYMNYNNAVNSYNNTYAQIDNTTMDNYNSLMSIKTSTENKFTTYEIFGAITGVAVVYTLADMLFIHAAFPVTAGIDPQNRQVVVTYKIIIN